MGTTNPFPTLNNIAGFMTVDSDFWITGRYERLHLINLLAIQQRLSKIEQEINDHLIYEQCLIAGRECAPPERPSAELLAELQDTIKAYDDAISSLSILKRSESPDQHVVETLKSVVPQFSSFYTELQARGKYEDATSRLLSTVTGPRSWFHRYVGRHKSLSSVFQEKHQSGYVEFTKFSEKRLKNTEFGIVAICLCLVQLLPVLALTLVSSKAARLAIIGILMVLVSLLNAAFANTVRATNFGAIAAYSAIVVVFISQSD